MKEQKASEYSRSHPYHGSHGKEHHRNDSSLVGLFHRCSHLIHHQDGGTHNSQRRVLQLLSEQEQLSQKDLQEQLHIQSGSISELITKMEAKGWVQRQKDSQDRRKVLLVLTEAGKGQLEQTPSQEVEQELFGALTEEEQQTLHTLLQKLSDSWSSDR